MMVHGLYWSIIILKFNVSFFKYWFLSAILNLDEKIKFLNELWID